jgi:dihydrolipoamide dehydrogenase
MTDYDLLILGTGGGAKLIGPSAALGYKVAVVEKGPLGGTCLNRGCIPSKMLIHPTHTIASVKDAHKHHLNFNQDFSVDFKNLISEITETVSSDSQGIVQKFNQADNIDLYQGKGKFVDNYTVEVNSQQITANKIFIATGARPTIPPIEGLEGTPYMTSTEALRNTKLPRKMIVIGGGYIGAELGSAYAEYGSEVEFLVRNGMVSGEDQEVVEEFTQAFSSRYDVKLQAKTIKVNYENGTFTVQYEQNGEAKETTGDALLVATGVTPNSDNIGLENTDIQAQKGFIQTDDYLRTGVPNIWALGDVVGNYMFRHTVNYEGEYLMKTAINKEELKPINYGPVPHAIFSHPEVGGVGKTEQELIQEGREYFKGVNPYRQSAQGMARKPHHGFAKLLFDKHTHQLLGAHIVGEEASNMIHMCISLMVMGGTLENMLQMIYIHPALPEIVRNAARKAESEIT